MRKLRERASAIFFADYNTHRERYVAGELPRLPFGDGKFDLTLASYLLFAYQDRFDYKFHRDSILEIMRVTRGEARIYPTVTFEAQASDYIPMMRADPALRQLAFTEVKTNFEFLVDSNSYLRVMRNRIVMRASELSGSENSMTALVISMTVIDSSATKLFLRIVTLIHQNRMKCDAALRLSSAVAEDSLVPQTVRPLSADC